MAGPSQTRAPRVAIIANTADRRAARRSSDAVEYGKLKADLPSDQELAELRRQQAAFSKTARQIDIHNSWFATPALAAPLAIMGLEAAGGWILGEAAPGLERGIANFLGREPYVRVGDNWATRAGRRAHNALKERLAQKPGWDYEPEVRQLGPRKLKPDVGAPARKPAYPEERFQRELKPNTATGKRTGARAVRKYEKGTGNKTRVIYYNPADFI